MHYVLFTTMIFSRFIKSFSYEEGILFKAIFFRTTWSLPVACMDTTNDDNFNNNDDNDAAADINNKNPWEGKLPKILSVLTR